MSAPTQFRKKPVVISAIQWTGENLVDVIHFTDGRPPNNKSSHAGMMWDQYVDVVRKDGLKIFTMEGKMDASIGDWIIKGVKGEHYPCKPEIFALTYDDASASTDLSQAAVAAALEAVAGAIRKRGQTEIETAHPPLGASTQAFYEAYDIIRALITKPQHDALAAHVAAEVAKARAEDAQAVAYTSSDLIQPASADMSGIDRAMLQSMAASFRGALEFSFNRHDMAELMDRCASRPASADTRTVTVAQLEAWIGAMEDWDEGDAAQKIDDILAIIGDTK